MESIHRCHASDFPLLVYILLILLLLLFLVHQFAGLCNKQKQMGNICPGDLGAPGPRVSVCLQLSLPPSGGSCSTVQAFLPDCSSRRSSRTRPRSSSEGRKGARTQLLRKQAVRTTHGLLPHPARPSLRVLLSFARRGNTTTGNKTAHARLKTRNGFILTFLRFGIGASR